nr:MAG TPA: hypothetical protein [Caudoviricetes sp.]
MTSQISQLVIPTRRLQGEQTMKTTSSYINIITHNLKYYNT